LTPVTQLLCSILNKDAVSATGVEPVTSIEAVLRDAASDESVVEAVKSETRKLARNRLDQDADFKDIGDGFPNSASFARK
jgi:hypothetical protein